MSAEPQAIRQASVSRGADRVVTILLIAAQALASFIVGGISLLFAMISDGCHDEPDDPFICSDAGGGVFFAGILLEWLLLFTGVVVSIVLAGRAAGAGRPSWTTPFIGTAVGLIGILVLLVNVAVASS